MATDIQIDPNTHDFVDDGAGGWVETNDSRTAVLCQLDSRLGEWWGDPSAGSGIPALLNQGNDDVAPATADDLRNAAKRALGVLVGAGLISDAVVTIGPSDAAHGIAEIDTTWRDRATNKPADLSFSPLGGAPS